MGRNGENVYKAPISVHAAHQAHVNDGSQFMARAHSCTQQVFVENENAETPTRIAGMYPLSPGPLPHMFTQPSPLSTV